MKLTITKQGILYCTFTEEDILKFFSTNFERLIQTQELVEKFSDILIRKAINMGRIQECEGEQYDINLYQTGEGEYSILLKKMLATDEKKIVEGIKGAAINV